MPRKPFQANVTRIYVPDKPDAEKRAEINQILLKHRDALLGNKQDPKPKPVA